MKPEDRLNADEVMCLQMAGMTTPEIMQTDVNAFDRLYDKDVEYEEYIDRANDILDRQEELGIVALSCHDEKFPSRLKAIGHDCPALIYCLGNLTLLNRGKAVAVIGARRADNAGLESAYKVAADYVRRGYVIVSGLAAGCDTAAHQAAIDNGGVTIAVVATGLDLIHPHESEALQAEILSHGGLILSEQIIGTTANASRLVARNRLQAALSEEVILAQCPERSGSLHTMRFAARYRKRRSAVRFPRRFPANEGNFNLLASDGRVRPIDLPEELEDDVPLLKPKGLYDYYLKHALEDSALLEAVSIPMFQRRYAIGFNRAMLIMDALIGLGVVERIAENGLHKVLILPVDVGRILKKIRESHYE